MQNPLTLVIFGATGDLYQSKLAPSLFNMFSTGLLPNDLNIIGFARKPLTDSDFQDLTKDAIFLKNKNPETKKIQDFLSCLKYIRGDLENLESFKSLGEKLSAEDYKKGFCTNKLFYLAVPPSLYEVIFKNIALAGLTVPCAPDVSDKEEKWTRVLVEKPFGKDIKDAERLDAMLGELFDESQIFRIDHYMAKEILQNILTFRFSNSSLEPTWNKENIEKIRIIFHYAKTVEKRGSFFDGVGMLRDVGQNHMLQMLALIAMEDPSKSNGEIHRVRQKVLEKTKLVSEAEIIRGQYEGYLMENGVKSDSNTETFFCFTLAVDNDRWKGVPFEFEAGNALDIYEIFIEVYFKNRQNTQKFLVSSDQVKMRDAYEKVFNDCITGDQTIFISTPEIMAEWRITEEIIKKWQAIPLVIYKKGSTGESIS